MDNGRFLTPVTATLVRSLGPVMAGIRGVSAWVVAALGLWCLVACRAPAPGAPDLAATAARLDALEIAITGNVAELRAAQLLNHHRVEGGVAACMKAAGRPYQPAPYVDRYQDFTDADLGYGTGRASVIDSLTAGGRRIVLNELGFARLHRAGALDRRAGPGDAEVLNGCTAAYQHRLYHDIEPPAGAYELASFQDLLETVGKDPAVVAAMRPYRTCMKQRHGYTVTDRSDFLFAQRLNRADAPIEGQPPLPAWTRGVAEIDAVFAADADCRRPAYEVAMALVAGLLDAWEDRHRQQLDAIRAEWRQRIADAAKLRP